MAEEPRRPEVRRVSDAVEFVSGRPGRWTKFPKSAWSAMPLRCSAAPKCHRREAVTNCTVFLMNASCQGDGMRSIWIVTVSTRDGCSP